MSVKKKALLLGRVVFHLCVSVGLSKKTKILPLKKCDFLCMNYSSDFQFHLSLFRTEGPFKYFKV